MEPRLKMQVLNLLHTAHWKFRMQKSPKNCHLGTIAQLYLCNWGTYRRSEKKLVTQQYLLHMSLQYGELWPTSGRHRSGSLGHPSWFQRVLHLDVHIPWAQAD